MGCATSKQKDRLCRNCKAPCSPPKPRRSSSVHHQHPPLDNRHLVLFSSSSLESLRSESFCRISQIDDVEVKIGGEKRAEFSVGLIEAKTWSKMINEKIPKIVSRTPIRTPPGEPEMINAWELMEGLEDISPLRPNHLRSFSFDFVSNLNRNEAGELFPKPMWLELADKEIVSKSLEFDPDIISTFREALEIEKNITAVSQNEETEENRENFKNGNLEESKVSETLVNVESFQIVEDIALNEEKVKTGEKAKNKVVLYSTSLRGVRKTFEDCCQIKLILKSIGVKIDERDVSMHSGFKDELKELLGYKFSKSPLPRVFLGENYIGGADEIRQMHEEGRLERMLLEGAVDMAVDGGVGGGVCEACGDVRFMPCERCYGSCKIYYGNEDDFDCEDECDESGCGFQRCPDCNENGLVRCPFCCD